MKAEDLEFITQIICAIVVIAILVSEIINEIKK